VLGKGLEATEASWPEIRAAFGWVWRFATVLANKRGKSTTEVQRRYRGVIASLVRHRKRLGSLAEAFDHFSSYGVLELPRTNNDLEQFFGSYRYHERRCSGRKVACPGTVVRGSVRLVSAAATRSRPIDPADLVPSDLSSWRDLRRRLERRQNVRTLGRRFRKDPDAYLKSLEDSLINQTLPP
jgi:hypothetical protein